MKLFSAANARVTSSQLCHDEPFRLSRDALSYEPRRLPKNKRFRQGIAPLLRSSISSSVIVGNSIIRVPTTILDARVTECPILCFP